MPRLKSERKLVSHKCGKCGFDIYRVITKEPKKVCPECGYRGHTTPYQSVPSQIKLNLNKY